MSRPEWGEVHYWLSVAMLVAVSLHLVFHYKWILCVVRGRKSDASGKRFAVALAALLALLVSGALVLTGPRTSVPRDELRMERSK